MDRPQVFGLTLTISEETMKTNSRTICRFALVFCLLALGVSATHSHADDRDCTSLLAKTPTVGPQVTGKRPQHVFIVVLENESFERTFRKSSDAPFLNCLARERGKLLENYYAIGHYSLDNYIAMISGQAPNAITQNDCQYFLDFTEVPNSPAIDGQLVGEGCVYPKRVETIANQLDDAHLTWRGYIEGMEHGYEDLEDNNGNCEHPAIGHKDVSQRAKPGHQYASRHNPFVYFHSIIDNPKVCSNDTQLENLKTDLKTVKTTPNLAFIVPDLCDDGHDEHCAGHPSDEKDGLPAAVDFYSNGCQRSWSLPPTSRTECSLSHLMKRTLVGIGETIHPAATRCLVLIQ
jgi:hypothetical protein